MLTLQKNGSDRKRMAGSVHEAIICTLEDRLSNSLIEYSNINKEQKYYDAFNRCAGECDLYALYSSNSNRYLLCFEIKTVNGFKHKKKALEQLDKDTNHYSKIFRPTRVFNFYVYACGNKYYIEWIKSKEMENNIKNNF